MTPEPTTHAHRARRIGAPGPLLIVTASFWAMLLCANLATPLYAGYGERFGFSTEVLVLIFAVYALVLLPSLIAFGQVSDRLGRRPVIAAGLVVQIGALVVFATAGGVAALFLARAVQGLGQGMMSGAATAALAELDSDEDARRPALLATLAQSGGAATGPLVAGVLAQWVLDPSALPFLVGIAVSVAMIALLPLVPETSGGAEGGWKIQRPGVPEEIRADFVRVVITAAAVWAVAGGLFLSVMPSYAAEVFGTTNLALLGLLTALMLGTSCAAQVLVRKGAPPAPAQAGGLVLLAVGLLGLVLAHWVAVLLIVGAVLAGAGHGLAFLAAQDNLTRIAPDDRRAEVSAAFYVCIYLGVAGPVIGIGVLAEIFSLFTAVAVFSAVTGAAALTTAAWHLGPRTRPDRSRAAPARRGDRRLHPGH